MDLLSSVKQKKPNNERETLRNNCKRIQDILPISINESIINLEFINQSIKNKQRSLCGKGAYSKVWKYKLSKTNHKGTFSSIRNSAAATVDDEADIKEDINCFAVKEISLLSRHITLSALRELKALKHINKSSNISVIKSYGAFVDPLRGLLHIVFEYSPLGTLQDWLDVRRKHFSEANRSSIIGMNHSGNLNTCSNVMDMMFNNVKLVIQIKDYLYNMIFNELHIQLHYIHGDIKPANILLYPLDFDKVLNLKSFPPLMMNELLEHTRLVLCDFGLSQALITKKKEDKVTCDDEEEEEEDAIPCGTNWYCSPEAYQSQSSSFSTYNNQGNKVCGDIWSLGILIWELLDIGEHPVKGHVEQIEKKELKMSNNEKVSSSSSSDIKGRFTQKYGFWEIFEAIEAMTFKAESNFELFQQLIKEKTIESENSSLVSSSDEIISMLYHIWQFIHSCLKRVKK